MIDSFAPPLDVESEDVDPFKLTQNSIEFDYRSGSSARVSARVSAGGRQPARRARSSNKEIYNRQKYRKKDFYVQNP